jgi:uncharacterized pyridoxal phosphate-containing UPF0001 family protein
MKASNNTAPKMNIGSFVAAPINAIKNNNYYRCKNKTSSFKIQNKIKLKLIGNIQNLRIF